MPKTQCSGCGVLVAHASGGLCRACSAADIEATPNLQPTSLASYLAEKGAEANEIRIDTKEDTSELDILKASEGERYTLGDPIASGGMGNILNAKDLNIRRRVAMKVMHKHVGDVGTILRFVGEAQITGQLEHPNIIPVHELGVDAAGDVFYTMKHVQGITLREVLDRIKSNDSSIIEAYPLNRLLNIFLKVCDAVAFANSKGVIHRDLKPDNVIIGEYGEVLVLDWGLAKIIGKREEAPDLELNEDGKPLWIFDIESIRSTSEHTTLAGKVLGTPAFMPPEQAYGKVNELDQRTDIYALGGILYSILTLHIAVEDSSPNKILLRVVEGRLHPPEVWNPGSGSADVVPSELPHIPARRIPESLAAVAMKAMSYKPENRYDDAKQMQQEIEAYQSGFATAAESATLWRQSLLLVRRHRREFALAAAAIILLLVTSIGFVLQLHEKGLQERRLRKAAEDAGRDAEFTARQLQSVSRRVAPEYVAKALVHMQAREWHEAHETIRTAVKLDGKNLAARFHLGRLLLSGMRFEEAQRQFAKCLRSEELGEKAKEYARIAREFQRIDKPDNSVVTEDETRLINRLIAMDDMIVAFRFYERSQNELQARELLLKSAKKALLEANPGKDVRVHYRVGSSLVSMKVENARNISPLRNLPITHLDLSDCPALFDLAPLKSMQIQWLRLDRCRLITSLEPLTGMPLEELSLRGCRNISNLQPLKGMPLRSLDLSMNQNKPNLLLRSLAGLEGTKLTSLRLANCAEVESLEPLRGLPVTTLDLTTFTPNERLQSLSGLEGMGLKWLSMARYKSLEDISALKGMKLNSLNLANTAVKELEALRGMPLTWLDLRGIAELESLEGLESRLLKTLFVSGCTKLKDLRPLRRSQLEFVNMSWCGSVKSLDGLSGLPLKRLIADHCGSLTDVTGLKGTKLHYLDLNYCRGIRDLKPLADLPLQVLQLRECTAISTLLPLKKLRLERLDLGMSWGRQNTVLTSLEGLENSRLKHLSLRFCPGIRSLRPLTGQPIEQLELLLRNPNKTLTNLDGLQSARLKTLDLSSFAALEDVSALKGQKLDRLELDNTAVSDISPLAGMPLTYLDLSNTDVDSLEALRGAPIERLRLRNCLRIRDLTPLRGSPLRDLNMDMLWGKPNRALRSLDGLQGDKLEILRLRCCPEIRSFAPLRGQPLQLVDISLGAAGNPFVKSMDGFQNSKATSLDLSKYIGLRDIDALRNVPLERLDLRKTLITDLRPLEGMPLVELRVNDKTDLSPLRRIPTLLRINDRPAEEFWKDHP